ncbi:two-component sensor histidine kinase [Dictyobacter vulcani]|uniref:histidine kinase n=1 Tax=Dictyobacter vulcani TaxID=2607529 RepID=A0A5J4KNA4_9CHLR|nr:HAMP domain-containing sensor histidine kinase [Dictyobacter vulcani]GER89345.1 two-component sensor histidine kinase [Dictyobacter vulcani]
MIKRLHSLAPPGLRLQLTLWYTTVSVVLMLIFCIAFYTTLQSILFNSFDAALQQRAQQVAESVGVEGGKLFVDDIDPDAPEMDAPAALIEPYNNYDNAKYTSNPHKIYCKTAHRDMVLVRVLDKSGREIYATGTSRALAIPRTSVMLPLAGQPWRATLAAGHDRTMRVYSTMLVDGRTIIGIVQVGQSLDPLYRSLDHIVLILFLLMLLALAICSLGSYWLSGRAFRSIYLLTRTAREITATGLHQRVLIPAARDEVRDLSIIFNQMVARLERAFIQQRRLVADASHELRTPVAVIRNLTEVALAQPAQADEYKHVLAEVNAESEHLGHLLNDLLVLARADEGQLKLDCEPVRLDLLALDVLDSLEPLARERAIALQVRRLTPATVAGDAARLIQVIMGLVDNALNYTNAGGKVTLSVEVRDTQAYLHVADTGMGIEPRDIEHIFERFYRADPARSRAAGGSGLGLSIVEWVVRAHRGSVEVQSELGNGSIFTVILPCLAAQI